MRTKEDLRRHISKDESDAIDAAIEAVRPVSSAPLAVRLSTAGKAASKFVHEGDDALRAACAAEFLRLSESEPARDHSEKAPHTEAESKIVADMNLLGTVAFGGLPSPDLLKLLHG